MTTKLMLRIASIISFLFTLGHSLGGLKKWSPTGETPVLRAMTDVQFQTMGVNRSYLDFFLGFGWSITIYMLLQSVLLWQLANLASTEGRKVRPMVAAFALATLATGIIAWRLILPVPAVSSGLLLAALVVAYWAARPVAEDRS